ncbi:MAG: hypothetical protein EZS28_015329 [Streblomastix strix]|uniref:non-specific serine/threonine protein kinase n=1 Tax=Streblomastix strix TaxID=222440 RepID=A0A5J4W2D5_9EUKA|nr:MAG: hypothetical protein EZS28_015329 [Streblomastix strix]
MFYVFILRVLLIHSEKLGLHVAKVIQSKLFDKNEWDAAGKLEIGQHIPFIVQFISAKHFGESVVILLEFANLKLKDFDLFTPKELFIGISKLRIYCCIIQEIVKIADFRLVKLEDQVLHTMKMSAKGTPLNMAPELVIGDGNANAKVDVWSAGVVLFQLAGHEYPLKASNLQELIMQANLMRQQTINRPAAIRDNLLWDLLIHLLAFDRKDRPTAEQALRHPYFTGENAQKEIMADAFQIAVDARMAKKSGDTSITQYDIDASYIVSGIEIKAALIDITNSQVNIRAMRKMRQDLQIQISKSLELSQSGFMSRLVEQHQDRALLEAQMPSQPSDNIKFTDGFSPDQFNIAHQIADQQNADQNQTGPTKAQIIHQQQNDQGNDLIPCDRCDEQVPFNQYQQHIYQHKSERRVNLIEEKLSLRMKYQELKELITKIEDCLKSFEEIEDKITEGPEKAELENEVAVLRIKNQIEGETIIITQPKPKITLKELSLATIIANKFRSKTDIKIQCNFCIDQPQFYMNELVQHNAEQHNTNPVVQCESCKKLQLTSEITFHCMKHTQKELNQQIKQKKTAEEENSEDRKRIESEKKRLKEEEIQRKKQEKETQKEKEKQLKDQKKKLIEEEKEKKKREELNKKEEEASKRLIDSWQKEQQEQKRKIEEFNKKQEADSLEFLKRYKDEDEKARRLFEEEQQRKKDQENPK